MRDKRKQLKSFIKTAKYLIANIQRAIKASIVEGHAYVMITNPILTIDIESGGVLSRISQLNGEEA